YYAEKNNVLIHILHMHIRRTLDHLQRGFRARRTLEYLRRSFPAYIYYDEKSIVRCREVHLHSSKVWFAEEHPTSALFAQR
ncbi:MAG TPA: hypothetical protein DCG49_05275, partial [Ruminococcus sp.]|nr:hypothetical protein [Ruminococcus sp.]